MATSPRTCITLDLSAWFVEAAIGEHGDLYVNNGNGRDGRATARRVQRADGPGPVPVVERHARRGPGHQRGPQPSGADSLLAIGTGQAVMTWGSSAGLRSIVDVLEGGLAQVDVELGAALAPGLPGGTRYTGTFGRAYVATERPPRGGAGGRLEVHQVADGARAAGRVVRRQRLPARAQLRLRPARRQGHHGEVPRVPHRPSTPSWHRRLPRPPSAPLLGPFTEVRETTLVALEEIAVANKDPIEALNDAAEESNEIIEEYNQRVQ